jgi:predicted Zn-dependent protease
MSIEVVFRISMMFLKTNESTLLTKIDKSEIETREVDSKKIRYLLNEYLPTNTGSEGNTEVKKGDFADLEQLVGHDLLAKAIFHVSSPNKPMPFSKDIPPMQLKKFKDKEKQIFEEKQIEELKKVAKKPVSQIEEQNEVATKTELGFTSREQFVLLFNTCKKPRRYSLM